MNNKLELVIDAKAALGEGPSWDSERNLLYWVDITQCTVHIYHPETNIDRKIRFDRMVTAIVPCVRGGAVVTMQDGFFFLDVLKEQLTPIHDPEHHLPNNRFNDGKCDPSGRFWAGTMSLKFESNQGSLYCLDTDQTVHKKAGGVSISNGIGWSPDHRTMYYIDSPTKQVVAYDFDLNSGNIGNERIILTIPDGEGVPDGMTTDSEGMLWIAHWGGYQVSRWNPSTGQKIDSVRVPVERVTSCAFGGNQLNELYITTAKDDATDDELLQQPQAGGVFRLITDVRGMPSYAYSG
jgi:sugar lactone lactonase YvrE